MQVRVEGRRASSAELVPGDDGLLRAVVDEVGHGDRYRIVLPDGDALADPASRWQPDGVEGPSAVFDPSLHQWTDHGFSGMPLWEHVIYELHVGTFSSEGTFDGVSAGLDHLVDLGITAIELMPVAQFPGRRNWGYDGVFPWAVHDSYGGPSGLQRLVDRCHGRGISVFLDVVYNHLGPRGGTLPRFGPYFTDRYRTPWGAGVNVDGPYSDEVRRYYLDNALSWFEDFHVDGLRLDAVHEIVDTSARPFLAELSDAVSDLARHNRRFLHLIAESADNDPRTVRPTADGGLGFEAQWNDDFHHALHALTTGERHGYYADFGRTHQLARAMSEGFVFQGEHSGFRRRRHGWKSAGCRPEQFVVYGQNHDQVGNRPRGDRPSASLPVDRLRLCAALVVLSPGLPLLFMGEEYAETAPFPFFVDYADPDLIDIIRRGRAGELAALGFTDEADDPGNEATFLSARLHYEGPYTDRQTRIWDTYRALVGLRRRHPALQHNSRADAHCEVIDGRVLRLLRSDIDHRQTLAAGFNVGGDPAPMTLPSAPEGWSKLIDSADPAIGGVGKLLPDHVGSEDVVELASNAFCVFAG